MAENFPTNWKPGEIIREKKSGRAFLVLHVYKNICTIISDLRESTPVAIVLLPARYNEFASDDEMEADIDEDVGGEIRRMEWKYEPAISMV